MRHTRRMTPAARDASLTLCAFRAVALDASGGAPFPRRLVICPPGTHGARDRGLVIVNDDTLTGLQARQDAMKLGTRLALDAEHCTVEGTPAYLAGKEPRAVLAWATLTASPAEGLVYEDIEPTPLGLEAWANKQYQDISPAVFRRADGTVLAVHSAAFCRHGEIDGLTIAAAAAGPRLTPFFAALSATLTPSIQPMNKLLKTILAALNIDLSEDAPEADQVAAGELAASKIAELMKAPPAAMTGDMKALQAQLVTLSASVTTLQNERDELARNELVRQAAAEGKVIPLSAEVLKLTPLSVLTEIVKQAKPGEVPLGRHTPKGQKVEAEPEAFSADTAEVFTKMGLTKEDFEKYGPKN